jgi:hypothetical protein
MLRQILLLLFCLEKVVNSAISFSYEFIVCTTINYIRKNYNPSSVLWILASVESETYTASKWPRQIPCSM